MDTEPEEEMDSMTEEELDGIETAHKKRLEAVIRVAIDKAMKEAGAAMSGSGANSMPFAWMIISVVIGLSMWVGIILFASTSF